jgi:uncharacterized protein YneF (UPF0154 family)
MNEKNKCTIDKFLDYLQHNPPLARELVRGLVKALIIIAFSLGLSFGITIAYLTFNKLFT